MTTESDKIRAREAYQRLRREYDPFRLLEMDFDGKSTVANGTCDVFRSFQFGDIKDAYLYRYTWSWCYKGQSMIYQIINTGNGMCNLLTIDGKIEKDHDKIPKAVEIEIHFSYEQQEDKLPFGLRYGVSS